MKLTNYITIPDEIELLQLIGCVLFVVWIFNVELSWIGFTAFVLKNVTGVTLNLRKLFKPTQKGK